VLTKDSSPASSRSRTAGDTTRRRLAHRQRRGRCQRQPVDVERARGSRTPCGHGAVEPVCPVAVRPPELAPSPRADVTCAKCAACRAFFVSVRERKAAPFRYGLPDRQRGGGSGAQRPASLVGDRRGLPRARGRTAGRRRSASADSTGKHADTHTGRELVERHPGKTAANKHRPAPAAVASGARTARAQAAAPTATAVDLPAVTALKVARPTRWPRTSPRCAAWPRPSPTRRRHRQRWSHRRIPTGSAASRSGTPR